MRYIVTLYRRIDQTAKIELDADNESECSLKDGDELGRALERLAREAVKETDWVGEPEIDMDYDFESIKY